jgi:GTP-binding protein
MLPVIALVGRPNVGKSTLFNRLTNTRDALVANYAGLTRDRKYGEAEMFERKFILIDTGGISGDEAGIDSAMAGQSLLAISEADVVLFMVDCRAGLHPADMMIAKHLRVNNKKVYIVANKVDGQSYDMAIAPFYEMGLGEIYPTTASHGRGVKSLMEEVLGQFPEYKEPSGLLSRGIRMAIVGRPNVGKSTLVNRLLGEDRVVVYDEPGTTRDSIYINYERLDKPYTIIDTAGIRRRKNVKETVEKFSIVKTLQAIEDANVVVLLMDASEGVVDQDLHLMGQVIDSGRALVVALNKWDGLSEDHRKTIKSQLDRRLQFVDFADIHFISALHGTGVGHLYESIDQAYHAATDKLTTNHLTRVLEDVTSLHQPPLVNGRRIKLRYAHPGGHNPPIIVIHGNQTDQIPSHYVRYLEKSFRKALDLHGTPVKIRFKSSDNPYAVRKGQETSRQAAKTRQLNLNTKERKSDRKKKKR